MQQHVALSYILFAKKYCKPNLQSPPHSNHTTTTQTKSNHRSMRMSTQSSPYVLLALRAARYICWQPIFRNQTICFFFKIARQTNSLERYLWTLTCFSVSHLKEISSDRKTGKPNKCKYIVSVSPSFFSDSMLVLRMEVFKYFYYLNGFAFFFYSLQTYEAALSTIVSTGPMDPLHLRLLY